MDINIYMKNWKYKQKTFPRHKSKVVKRISTIFWKAIVFWWKDWYIRRWNGSYVSGKIQTSQNFYKKYKNFKTKSSFSSIKYANYVPKLWKWMKFYK